MKTAWNICSHYYMRRFVCQEHYFDFVWNILDVLLYTFGHANKKVPSINLMVGTFCESSVLKLSIISEKFSKTDF